MGSKKGTEQSSLNLARIIAALVSVAGFGIMLYLTYIHYESAQGYFCDISGDISCSQVAQSAYSEILGIPVAILGLGYFAFIFLLVLLNKKKEIFQFILLLTIFVLVPSLYLSFVEFFKIKAFCVLCEASKVLMLAIGGVSFVAMRQRPSGFTKKAILVIAAGFVAAVITYFVQVNKTLFLL
ncbi:MAG TPA: vitamin K epoxide reductase family protein [Candidatus Nanoarchaeia archaeon]